MEATNWDKVYTILVEECGAAESEREYFVSQHTEEHIREWRFGGSLGFGGKFRDNGNGLSVDCYREDETPKRIAAVEGANRRLTLLSDTE